jgi:hypothetical protein
MAVVVQRWQRQWQCSNGDGSGSAGMAEAVAAKQWWWQWWHSNRVLIIVCGDTPLYLFLLVGVVLPSTSCT